MNLHTKKFNLTTETFRKLRDLICEKSGIYYSENKKYLLENKLIYRIEKNKLMDYEEYYQFLKYNPRREEEFTHLFDAITTIETSFSRNSPQLEVFEKEILPKVIHRIKKQQRNNIRIWSAACATGEEPYTIAIILMENRMLMAGINFEIIGTDINKKALHAAHIGIYHKNSLRNLPQHLLEQYFSKNSYERYAIKPETKKNVTLKNLNLYNRAAMKSIRGIDIIFCRNVLIYFSEKAKIQVISSFYDSLLHGGFLFLGHSESLLNMSSDFKLKNINRIPVYKKQLELA